MHVQHILEMAAGMSFHILPTGRFSPSGKQCQKWPFRLSAGHSPLCLWAQNGGQAKLNNEVPSSDMVFLYTDVTRCECINNSKNTFKPTKTTIQSIGAHIEMWYVINKIKYTLVDE